MNTGERVSPFLRDLFRAAADLGERLALGVVADVHHERDRLDSLCLIANRMREAAKRPETRGGKRIKGQRSGKAPNHTQEEQA